MQPEILLGSGVSLPTYYLVVSLSALAGCLWFLRRAEHKRMPRLIAIDLTLIVLVAGFVGARLLHVTFEEPEYYRQAPAQIFAIWNGGFVFLGGLIAAALGAAFFCDWKREPFWLWADLAAPAAALAYAFGRVGCFLNGCCYGSECLLPWAVFMGGASRHPTQLYASAWELFTLFVLLTVERIARRDKLPIAPGSFFAIWLVFHGMGRLIMEHFRVDPRGDEIWGLSLSSWLSLILLGSGLALLLQFLKVRSNPLRR